MPTETQTKKQTTIVSDKLKISSDKPKLILGMPTEEYFSKGHRACAGCGPALAMRFLSKAAGKNTIITQATGCMEVVSTPYPQTAWKLPWLHCAFENAAATASGVHRTLKAQGRREGTNIIAIGGDGGTFDIGFQALSGAAERREKFTYICYDNEAYMNCLSRDTFIMTQNGLKRITEIQIGDIVYAFDQQTHQPVLKKCSGVFDNGIKDVFELNTLHHTIKATANHPFLVLSKNKGDKKENKKFVWKLLESITKGDEIVCLKNTIKEGKSFFFTPIKISKKGDYKVNKINEIPIPTKSSIELMELLGLYVGDGWVRMHKAEISFSVPQNSKARKRVIEIHKKLFSRGLTESKNEVHIYSINLANFINSLGFGNSAKTKLIPSWVFTLPIKEKEAFLKGLMLSDGYKINNSNRYVSASYDLLKTLRLLLQTINYRVGKIHQQTKKKGMFVVYRKLLEDSTYGYICFSKRKEWNTQKYKSQYKNQNYLIENEYFEIEKVCLVKLIGKEPTLDLRVEGEHNFVADGIVVHNTGIQRSGSTPKYSATTTSPAGSKIHGKMEYKKPMPFIMAAHGIDYVATANIAYVQDFVMKVRKALASEGVSYIQVLAPCTLGWKYPSKDTIKQAKLATQTRVTPMFEIVKGKLKITMDVPEPRPVKEFLQLQGRFKHLSPAETDEIQKHVDLEWERIKKIEQSGIEL